MTAGASPLGLRPLSIGEIFDRTITLLVRRRRAAFVLAMATALPLSLTTLLQAYGGNGPAAHVLQVLMAFVGGLMAVYSSAGIAVVVAGGRDDPSLGAVVDAVSARFWPLIRVGLLTGVVFFVAFAVAIFVAGIAVAALGPVAGGVVAIPVVLAALPVLFACELSFSVAVLERVPATVALRTAWRRVFGDRFWRSWRLALAVALAYLGPFIALEGLAGLLLTVSGWAWVSAAASFVEYSTAFIFFNAVMAVISIDYRVRQEGFDLEAALDAPQPS